MISFSRTIHYTRYIYNNNILSVWKWKWKDQKKSVRTLNFVTLSVSSFRMFKYIIFRKHCTLGNIPLYLDSFTVLDLWKYKPTCVSPLRPFHWLNTSLLLPSILNKIVPDKYVLREPESKGRNYYAYTERMIISLLWTCTPKIVTKVLPFLTPVSRRTWRL